MGAGGMQKTCSFSGREFYALGRFGATADNGTAENALGRSSPSATESGLGFRLLDCRSDYANSAFDAGEGYASMTVWDPRGQGRNTPGVRGGGGRPRPFHPMVETDRGWFGTLSLPRTLQVVDLTGAHGGGASGHDVFLSTAPLPELASLRANGTHFRAEKVPLPAPAASAAAAAAAVAAVVVPFGIRGTSMIEVDARFALPPAVVHAAPAAGATASSSSSPSSASSPPLPVGAIAGATGTSAACALQGGGGRAPKIDDALPGVPAVWPSAATRGSPTAREPAAQACAP